MKGASTIRYIAVGGAVALGLLAAWPLGLYDRWRSPCRTLFTPADAARLGIPGFVVSKVDDEEKLCVLVGTPSATDFTSTVVVTYRADPTGTLLQEDLGFWDREAPHVTKTPVAGLGDEAYLVDHVPHAEGNGARALGDEAIHIHRAHTVVRVNLGAGHYSHADALEVVDLLKTRQSKLDRY